MIDPSHNYAYINTTFVDNVLSFTVKKACLPKEMKLKEGVKYRLGKVQNSFVTNILGCIVWMYMCGGRANMNWVKKIYFDNSKVRADYYDILTYLISQNLDATKSSQV